MTTPRYLEMIRKTLEAGTMQGLISGTSSPGPLLPALMDGPEDGMEGRQQGAQGRLTVSSFSTATAMLLYQ